jgi:hypothetical protein
LRGCKGNIDGSKPADGERGVHKRILAERAKCTLKNNLNTDFKVRAWQTKRIPGEPVATNEGIF